MKLLQIPKLGSQDPCGWLAILVPSQPYPPGPWIFLVIKGNFFFILKSLNNPLLCDKNLYLDIGTWDHRGHRGLAKSHTASASPAVQKSVFLSQKYYFLRNSATHSPYNLFLILNKKFPPPRQLFENKQGLNPTHLPIATIRQVQEELPGRGNGNSSWDCSSAF